MHRSKRELTQRARKLIFDGLFMSHLNYGLTIFGHTNKTYLKALEIQHKKALRAVENSAYNAHTAPICKRLEMLNFNNNLIFSCMCLVKATLGITNLENIWPRRALPHDRDTRLSTDHQQLSIPGYRLKRLELQASTGVPRIWNSFPLKVRTMKAKGFKTKLKRWILHHQNEQ